MEKMFSVPRVPDATVPTGHTQHTLLDKINAKIGENDPHYAKFKWDRHSNFKYGVLNTLGVFENSELFAKQVGQLALIGGMYTDRTEWVIQSSEETKEATGEASLVEFVKQVAYDDSLAQFEYHGVDQNEIAKFCLTNGLLRCIFDTYTALASV